MRDGAIIRIDKRIWSQGGFSRKILKPCWSDIQCGRIAAEFVNVDEITVCFTCVRRIACLGTGSGRVDNVVGSNFGDGITKTVFHGRRDFAHGVNAIAFDKVTACSEAEHAELDVFALIIGVVPFGVKIILFLPRDKIIVRENAIEEIHSIFRENIKIKMAHQPESSSNASVSGLKILTV